MAVFSIAFNNTIEHEGGYQKNPADKGNYNSLGDLVGTKYGITPKMYEAFYTKYFNKPIPNVTTMFNLTLNEAFNIYKNLFWNHYKLDLINNQDIANQIYDIFVNHSYKGASGIIQQAILDAGGNLGTYGKDYKFGGETLNEVLKLQYSTKFNNDLVKNRVDYYNYLAQLDTSYQQFLKGWITRAETFLKSSFSTLLSIGLITGSLTIGYLLLNK